ncbi:hypothetical protein COW99_03290 [Candidatus Roizmanbacteria bacterium CG22_combo_CG10-13_8_21_14_all_38_20]|uniref:PIN domain-containing protein n=1 Tax=Candidatus Roizmanbacteria bacterium CG22_combo_CG10-13_8_21_14_all_38_20 TaxID=1974862 RepID=A0A2H0BVR8_9BACT|nr:MAG: hypothetical protein COW99_03290 [Candidatus Roizmanbacteria bacterium CG22_combo_CG10-13_8_21_14_all_38_20]PJC31544.1 MAG: hypothetical protein CO050_03110 [Candidatus Roizmanbacteria bacterium CG_4_9_14_0_2_um_filter_38_17]
MRIFLDSDVIISSLLSSSGASHFLIHQTQVKLLISSISHKELKVVIKRLNIEPSKLKDLINKKFEVLTINNSQEDIKQKYMNFVVDIGDAHIVAGANKGNSKYLITYNLKHFKKDKIKNELDISIMTPALFLQYLRLN